jgi:hypothetical protein
MMSENGQIYEAIENLTVRLLAQRDLLVCLLAEQSRSNPDLLRDISEGLDTRLAQTVPPTATANVVNMGERIRAETDRMIQMAQRALGHGTN